MTCTRNKCNDWTFPYFTDNNLGPVAVTNNMLIHNDLLWVHANNDFPTTPERQNFLQAIDIHTGEDKGKISISALNGKEWNAYDLQLDNNGLIWVQGETLFSGTATAFFVLNPESRTVEQSILTESATEWNGRTLHHDPNNNLMWAIQNATTYAAISTDTYTVVKTIVPIKLGSEIFNGRGLDTKQSELWFFWGTNKILVYSTTTGNLLRTLTSSFTGSNTSMKYIPERNTMMVYSAANGYEMWSTDTYTITSTFVETAKDPYHALKYVPQCERLVGRGQDGPNPTSWPCFVDFNSPHDVSYPDDPFELGADAYMVNVYTVDSQGSIYFRLYDDINFLFYVAKIAYGQYNRVYETDPNLYTGQSDVFNREIVFDLDLGAFFVNDFGHTDSAVRINDFVSLPMYTQSNPDTNVLVGSEHVIITSGEEVVATGYEAVSRTYNPRGERFKYLATSATGVSLVEYRDFSFRDYVTIDGTGIPFPSYLLTGYDLSGDMMKKKRSIYLIVYCERTEKTYTLTEDGVVLSVQSGCIVQSQWEWANSAATGRWGRPFQAYRLLRPQPSNPQTGDILDYGERVIVTKNKLRGNGRSLSLFIQAECSKDLKLLGWGLDMTRQDFV